MEGPKVQLVVTCLVDALAPEVGRAALAVLEGQGCVVEFPEGQTCCGQPAFNVGMDDQARVMAAHMLDVLDTSEGSIVLPSGSCTDMIVHHYPELFAGTERAEQAHRVAARAREFTQFLVDDLGADPGVSCEDCVIAYHHSCHGLRGLGLEHQATQLLAGAVQVPLDGAKECCGFGGLFSIELPSVSTAIMEEKLDRLQASGANTLVANDVSCLIHLEGGLRRRGSDIQVKHISQVLSHENFARHGDMSVEE